MGSKLEQTVAGKSMALVWHVYKCKPFSEKFTRKLVASLRIRNINLYSAIRSGTPCLRKSKPFYSHYSLRREDQYRQYSSILQWTTGTPGIVKISNKTIYKLNKFANDKTQIIESAKIAQHMLNTSPKHSHRVLFSESTFAEYAEMFEVHHADHKRLPTSFPLLIKQRFLLEVAAGNLQQPKQH